MSALLFFIILTDIAIIIAIAILVVKLKNLFGAKAHQFQTHADELRTLIVESGNASTSFFNKMNETANRLVEILRSLDEKETRLQALLSSINNQLGDEPGLPGGSTHYDALIRLVKEGLPEEEIRQTSGFSDAEITLILDLHRQKTQANRNKMPIEQ